MKVRIASVGPGVEPWRREIVRLFESFAVLDGPLAQAQFVANFDRTVDTSTVDELHHLGVDVRLISPVDPRCAMGNNQLNLDDAEEYDWVVSVDCDVVVARDFSQLLRGDMALFAPADFGLMPMSGWRSLFDHFEVKLPHRRFVTRMGARPTPPYFNTGVMAVPAHQVHDVRSGWRRWLIKVADAFENGELPALLGPVEAFIDQIAFSLFLAETDLPYRAQPRELHVGSHATISPLLRPNHISPYLIHYHHHVDDEGRIEPSRYRGLNAAIGRVNTRLESLSPLNTTVPAHH